MNKLTRLLWLVGICALLLRLSLMIWAGNAPETRLSGGSDTIPYQTLADNLVHHRGFTYAGEPTALRPPLYPLFLAGCELLSGTYYRILARLLQLLGGVLAAVLCGKIAERLGGSELLALVATLASPTLIFFSPEILTETFAALTVAAFLWVLVTEANPAWAGLLIGLGMLERFNLAILAVVFVAYQVIVKRPGQAARNVALCGLVALAVVSPWFIRNLKTFEGQVLYTTHTGTNLLQGLIAPDGRTQLEDKGKLQSASGWSIADVETNSPKRHLYAPEPELDRAAKAAAMAELGHVNLFRLTLHKLAFFWLGLDQLDEPQFLAHAKYLIRLPGVFIYWLLLGAAIMGWRRLHRRNPQAALLFVLYTVIITALHLPFVMNTRIRAPLIEPALAVLAGMVVLGAGDPKNREATMPNRHEA